VDDRPPEGSVPGRIAPGRAAAPGRPRLDFDLTAGEAAQRLGVAVTTLRTWHQRYGLGPTGHTAGRHRRYTAADMDRLDRMRWLTARGMSPAQAAREVMDISSGRLAATFEPPATADHHRHGGAPTHRPTPEAGKTEAGKTEGGKTEGGKTGAGGTAERLRPRDGGHTIPVGRSAAAARGLARAAARLDDAAMDTLIAEALDELGVITAWETVLAPVLRGVGRRHASSGTLVEVEHLLSACVSAGLARVPRPVDRAPARTLLACADEELHTLPIEALAAALAEGGEPARLLGARVPPDALLAAARRTGPRAVVVWAHSGRRPAADDLLQLAVLPERPVLLVAAGAGWSTVRLPPWVNRPENLRDAVELLRAGAWTP
jgi:DNA-binding transcriptional MerR regulator